MGFGHATCLCAAHICLFRLINTHNRALPPPPPIALLALLPPIEINDKQRKSAKKIPVLGKNPWTNKTAWVRGSKTDRLCKAFHILVVVVVVIASNLFLNSCYISNVGKLLYNLYVICTVCSESFERLSAKSNSRNGFCFQEEMHEWFSHLPGRHFYSTT